MNLLTEPLFTKALNALVAQKKILKAEFINA